MTSSDLTFAVSDSAVGIAADADADAAAFLEIFDSSVTEGNLVMVVSDESESAAVRALPDAQRLNVVMMRWMPHTRCNSRLYYGDYRYSESFVSLVRIH